MVYGKPGIAMAIKPRVFVTEKNHGAPSGQNPPISTGALTQWASSGSVYINSQIPSSSGLGSSAAVTVATLSAINDEFARRQKPGRYRKYGI